MSERTRDTSIEDIYMKRREMGIEAIEDVLDGYVSFIGKARRSIAERIYDAVRRSQYEFQQWAIENEPEVMESEDVGRRQFKRVPVTDKERDDE